MTSAPLLSEPINSQMVGYTEVIPKRHSRRPVTSSNRTSGTDTHERGILIPSKVKAPQFVGGQKRAAPVSSLAFPSRPSKRRRRRSIHRVPSVRQLPLHMSEPFVWRNSKSSVDPFRRSEESA